MERRRSKTKRARNHHGEKERQGIKKSVMLGQKTSQQKQGKQDLCLVEAGCPVENERAVSLKIIEGPRRKQ